MRRRSPARQRQTRPKQKRTGWLVLGAALAGGALLGSRVLAAGAPSPSSIVSDPWPNSPVLTRLFRLNGPRTAAQGSSLQNLKDTAQLTPGQLSELQQLSSLEQQNARLSNTVMDRLQARTVNTQIASSRQQKDSQARQILGAQYPAFRQWLRGWWKSEVTRSRADTEARQLVLPAGKVPPEMQQK